jgi:hypothetical protein
VLGADRGNLTDRSNCSSRLDLSRFLPRHRTGHSRLIRGNSTWDCPARRGSDLLASGLHGGHRVLEEICRRHPTAKIVHWLEPDKLGRELDREMEQ